MATAFAQTTTTQRAPVYYLDADGNVLDTTPTLTTTPTSSAAATPAGDTTVRSSGSTAVQTSTSTDSIVADRLSDTLGGFRTTSTGQIAENLTQRPVFWNNMTLLDIIQMFVVYAFIIAAALSAIFVFWGGIKLISSGGDQAKVGEAWGVIRWAILGIIITIFSFTIVAIVGRFFNLNLLDYLSFDLIQEHINIIIEKAKGGAADSAGSFIIE
ncbi:hypothetical protein H6771_00950 [Candidatus Peribacteria bacterium]|nr:hypothetical protein [Candidatus Peribacteria bacterium]